MLMGLQLIHRRINNSLIGSSKDDNLDGPNLHLFRILVVACLPLLAHPSLAHFTYQSNAPSSLKTPPTGTGFDRPAKNQMYLSSSLKESLLLA